MNQQSVPYTKENLPEIVVRFSIAVPPEDRVCIKQSRNAADVLRLLWPSETIEYQEVFFMLCLGRNNDIIGYFLHSIGGLTGTIVDIKQILAVAIKANAASVILCHNHPSSNIRPSHADMTLTRKIVKGAALLDVTVLDHLILTTDSYYSFADSGTLPYGDTSAAQRVEEYTTAKGKE